MAAFSVPGVELVPIDKPHDEVYGPTREWCTWDRMYGKEYMVPALTVFSRELVQQVAEVTQRAYRLFMKVTSFVQETMPDSYLVHQLGIPEPLCPLVRERVPLLGITRFDLALTENGMYLLEYNADTPTGVVETAYVAESVIRRFSSWQNPSSQMNALIRDVHHKLIQSYRQMGFTGPIVFSASGGHEEDRGTVEYTQQVTGVPSRFVPLENLRVHEDGLYANGEKVSIWFRLYPWEHLPFDQDKDGFPTGIHLLHLLRRGELAAVSPPSAIIPQSKGLQALIWDLAELRHPLLNEEELSFIRTHMLPSSFDDSRFRESGVPYVSKPFFGREGGAVSLYDGEGRVEATDKEEHYWEQPMLYQKRVQLPMTVLPTEEGLFQGRLLIGAFCIGGQFAGILPRIGGEITGNLAYFCPAAVKG